MSATDVNELDTPITPLLSLCKVTLDKLPEICELFWV